MNGRIVPRKRISPKVNLHLPFWTSISFKVVDIYLILDAVDLDLWVLHHLETLFQNATLDATLNAKLHSNQVVFFLHLLGLDTTGHAYRPHSLEYMRNIQVVDEIVQRTEEVMREFYGDDETSYVFTADHGMSVIGNHGDGRKSFSLSLSL